MLDPPELARTVRSATSTTGGASGAGAGSCGVAATMRAAQINPCIA
jgi:hypothetical protein